jgi:uncharacterized protein (TIGR02466 family)
MPDIRPEIIPAFSTPVIALTLPNHEQMNANLSEVILERRQTDKGLVRSNVNSWHSDEDFVSWGGAYAQQLAQTFGSVCSGITEFPPSDAGQRRWVVRMWANVFERGTLNRLHCHPGAFWSGVYYLNDGRQAEGEDIGGDLILHSPHELASSMYAPDVQIKLPNGQRLSSAMTIKPRPGLGVIFPSWLMHEVDPYRGNALRISIAFNFSLSAEPSDLGGGNQR